MYAAAAPKLIQLLEQTGATRVIDCCSGAAGPWPDLLERLNAAGHPDLDVLLTDRYPRPELALPLAAWSHGRLTYHPEPVDARSLPESWAGVRTFFTCFHHFRPAEASAILRATVARRAAIGIFEFTSRRRSTVLGMLRSPGAVLADTRAIQPRTWARRIWTFIIPVVPVLYCWDGMVSHMRSYTPGELYRLAVAAAARGYYWEAGALPSPHTGYPITYLIGYPIPGWSERP
jgi:hypothetical protein